MVRGLCCARRPRRLPGGDAMSGAGGVIPVSPLQRSLVIEDTPPSMTRSWAGGAMGVHPGEASLARRPRRRPDGPRRPRGLARVEASALLVFPTRRRRDEGNHRSLIEKSLGDAWSTAAGWRTTCWAVTASAPSSSASAIAGRSSDWSSSRDDRQIRSSPTSSGLLPDDDEHPAAGSRRDESVRWGRRIGGPPRRSRRARDLRPSAASIPRIGGEPK